MLVLQATWLRHRLHPRHRHQDHLPLEGAVQIVMQHLSITNALIAGHLAQERNVAVTNLASNLSNVTRARAVSNSTYKVQPMTPGYSDCDQNDRN